MLTIELSSEEEEEEEEKSSEEEFPDEDANSKNISHVDEKNSYNENDSVSELIDRETRAAG